MHKIEFLKVADIPTFSDEFALVAAHVSNDGVGLFLYVERKAEEWVFNSVNTGHGVFPKTRMDEPARFVLLQTSGGEISKCELPALNTKFPRVDVFRDGRILIVGTRSAWRSAEDYDLNGLIYDPRSGAQTHVCLGDGIEDVSVDSLDRIWVSYFDEGIFGNFGWGSIGPKPIGASGLNCFSAGGDLVRSFPFDDGFGGIMDCYAMNVQGQTTAIYFYTEFPLCRISSDFERHYWETELSGCRQFAIGESRVLFDRQRKDPPSVGYLAELGDGRIGQPQKVEFLLPDKTPIFDGWLLGRGAEMHYFENTGWYKASLNDITR